MFGVTTSDDYRPVAWMGRYPVDVTTMLVGLHIALAVIGCILFAAGTSVLSYLQFDSTAVFYQGQVWRIVTYAFVHPPAGLLWFAVEMYMLFVFGREVERFLGQRAYVVLYLILLIAPSLLLTTWGLWQPTALAGSPALQQNLQIRHWKFDRERTPAAKSRTRAPPEKIGITGQSGCRLFLRGARFYCFAENVEEKLVRFLNSGG